MRLIGPQGASRRRQARHRDRPARPVALEQPIRLHQLDTRIALQAGDQGFERLVGRHLDRPGTAPGSKSAGIFPPVADDIEWPGPGRWGPLRLEPLGQGHDDLPGLQLLGHAGFGDGGRRFVFRDGAAAGKDQTQGVGQNRFPVRGRMAARPLTIRKAAGAPPATPGDARAARSARDRAPPRGALSHPTRWCRSPARWDRRRSGR